MDPSLQLMFPSYRERHDARARGARASRSYPARPDRSGRRRSERRTAKPVSNDPSPINTSSSNGAPVEARADAFDAAVPTGGALTGPGLATNDAGIGVAPDEDEDDGLPVPEVGAVEASVV